MRSVGPHITPFVRTLVLTNNLVNKFCLRTDTQGCQTWKVLLGVWIGQKIISQMYTKMLRFGIWASVFGSTGTSPYRIPLGTKSKEGHLNSKWNHPLFLRQSTRCWLKRLWDAQRCFPFLHKLLKAKVSPDLSLFFCPLLKHHLVYSGPMELKSLVAYEPGVQPLLSDVRQQSSDAKPNSKALALVTDLKTVCLRHTANFRGVTVLTKMGL